MVLYRTCWTAEFIRRFGKYLGIVENGYLYQFGKNKYVIQGLKVYGVRGSVCIG